MFTNENDAVGVITLDDGVAEPIGGGLFVVLQRDETAAGRPLQNVVLTLSDLETLRANETSLDPVALEDGEAYLVSDGAFLIYQTDETAPGHPVQSVYLSANDADAMRAAA